MATPDEIERLAQRYAGNDFRERQIVTEMPIFIMGGEEWTLSDFIAMLQQAVPAQYAASATVHFELGSYGDSDKLTVTYERPETDEEVAKRIKEALHYAECRVQEERATFEQLKQKFEANG